MSVNNNNNNNNNKFPQQHQRWTPQLARRRVVPAGGGGSPVEVSPSFGFPLPGTTKLQPIGEGLGGGGGRGRGRGGGTPLFSGAMGGRLNPRRQWDVLGHNTFSTLNIAPLLQGQAVAVPAARAPVLPKLGMRCRDYGCLRMVGAGQFAEVMSGTDPETRQPVALKKIKLNGLDKKTLGLMYTEVSNLARLNHPNIVKLHRYFEQTEQMPPGAKPPTLKYLVAVLELVGGGDLEGFLEAQTDPTLVLMEESLIWHLFAAMCEGVKYMHTKDYIHRDLKPANILVSRCLRTVKLADFGLSRTASRFDKITTFTGTRYYMAPERIDYEEYGKPSDVWSLGCILYELATLRSPFCGEHVNLDSLQEKVVVAYYPPMPEDAYSKHLHWLVAMCLAKEPLRRPTIAELAEAAKFMNKRLSWLTSPEAATFWRHGD